MSGRRDFPAWIYITSFIVIVVLAILPLILTLIGVGVAQSYGCSISDSSVSPCLIGGSDWGGTLQFAGNAFWLLLFSMPIAFLLFIVWLVVFIVHLVAANRARKAVAS